MTYTRITKDGKKVWASKEAFLEEQVRERYLHDEITVEEMEEELDRYYHMQDLHGSPTSTVWDTL